MGIPEFEGLGVMLHELRTKTGLSAAEVGEIIESAKKTVYNIEHALYQPSLKTMRRMAKLYGVSYDSLMKKIEINDEEFDLSGNVRNLLGKYEELKKNPEKSPKPRDLNFKVKVLEGILKNIESPGYKP